MNLRLSRSRGFTVVEVMIALIVLVFGIYGALDLYINAQRQSERNEYKSLAAYVAKGKLEELKAAGYDNLASYVRFHQNQGTGESIPYPDNIAFISQPLPETYAPSRALSRIVWQADLALNPENESIQVAVTAGWFPTAQKTYSHISELPVGNKIVLIEQISK
jgi:type II secretory pathway pseudopilin PulG